MKKVLSFVLVLAMVLGSVAMAFAVDYSDMSSSKYTEAVETLSNLGVLNGYGDGTFKPENTIKRAEFAKVVVEALGLTTSAASTSPFSDVPADKWYAKYVALAAQLGIVNGKTATTFGPDDTIQDTHAIVMVVRALGYTDEYFGGYNAAKYISQATALGLMNGVNAGTGASTRGNVAQLVYNALDQQIVRLDKDGAIDAAAPRDTMAQRLTGTPVDKDGTPGADKFIYGVTNGYTAASGVNMTAYLGKYVTAVAKDAAAARAGQVSGVKQVLSKTLVGAYNATSGKFVADGVSYTLYLNNGTYATEVASPVALINNGVVSGTATLASEAGNTVTLEVALDGTTVTDIYSLAKWTPATTYQYVKGDYKEATLKLSTYNFKPNNVGKIDTTSFQLVGADSLDAIAEDDVVTIYLSNGYISKIEVGTTVTGQLTKRVAGTSGVAGSKWVLGGTTYTVNASAAAANIPTDTLLGNNGTGYLAYDGTLFAFVSEQAAKAATNYGVLIARRGSASDGFNSQSALVKVFTTDGSTVDFSGNSTSCPSGAWNSTIGGIALKTPVKYTLDSNGKIATMETSSAVTATKTDILKDGTVSGQGVKLNDATLLIEAKADGSYAVVKAADVLNTSVTYSGLVKNAANTAVVFALIERGSSASSSNYVLVTGTTPQVYDATAKASYKEIKAFDKAGNAVTYKDFDSVTTDANTVVASNAALIKLSVDAASKVTAYAAYDGATPAAIYNTTSKSAIQDGFFVEAAADGTMTNYKNQLVNANALVFVWDATNSTWTKGSVSDLAVAEGGIFSFYDTDSTPDGYADIVLVAAK